MRKNKSHNRYRTYTKAIHSVEEHRNDKVDDFHRISNAQVGVAWFETKKKRNTRQHARDYITLEYSHLQYKRRVQIKNHSVLMNGLERYKKPSDGSSSLLNRLLTGVSRSFVALKDASSTRKARLNHHHQRKLLK